MQVHCSVIVQPRMNVTVTTTKFSPNLLQQSGADPLWHSPQCDYSAACLVLMSKRSLSHAVRSSLHSVRSHCATGVVVQ
jgi:hypothetical protein